MRIEAPLHFLPAFELVARHLSIKRAAVQLGLTASAVSQQVHALEEALGVKLLRRMTRALALTPEGEQFACVVNETLAVYRRGTERMRAQAGPVLHLSADPYVAHELLIPALHTFHGALEIETSSQLADFEREPIDAAVRYGYGRWTGLSAKRLCEVTASVVCAPGLIPGGRLPSARSLARYPLIRLRGSADGWPLLARALNVQLPREQLVFDSYSATLRAAEKGLGLAIAVFPVSTNALLDGRLVLPLSVHVQMRSGIYFVCRRGDAKTPPIAALREWLLTRFADLPALPAAFAPKVTVQEPA